MLALSLMQSGYTIINAIWVGKFLGKEALAAVTVSFPIVFVLISIAAGLTMATNILIAQYYGAREMTQVRRVVQSSTLLMIVVSLVMLIVGELATVPLLRLMNTPPNVLHAAASYMQLFWFTMPCSFGVFLISSMLRGIGDSTTPLKFQTVSIVATAILDPLLIFGWPGLATRLGWPIPHWLGVLHLPGMGLNGTAVATILAQVLALVTLIAYLRRTGNPVSPALRKLRSDLEIWKLTFKIGLPSALQQALVSVGMVFVIGFVNHFGEDATAAFGAAMRIDQFAFMPAMSIGMAASNLAGQNIGAGKFGRVNQVFWWGTLLSGIITLLVTVFALWCPELLMRMFVNDAHVMALGKEYLHIVGACYVFFAVMFVSNGVINGAGQTFVTTVISLVSLYLLRVPLAALLSKYGLHDGQLLVPMWKSFTLHLPVPAYLQSFVGNLRGIWLAMAFSFLASMLLSLLYYFTGRWKRAVVKHGPAVSTEEAPASTGEPLDNPA